MTRALPLLDPARSGVYRTPAHVDAARQGAGEPALWLDVDLAAVRDKRELLTVLQASCGFSETFGHNWDALADTLQDLSWCPPSAYVLYLRHAERAAQILGADWLIFLEVLTESADFWKARDKPFVVFVDGLAERAPWI